MADLRRPVTVKTLKLQDPVDYGGELVAALEFRKLITKDHLDVESLGDVGSITKSCKYLELLTNQPPYVIGNLSHVDFMAAQEVLVDFLK